MRDSTAGRDPPEFAASDLTFRTPRVESWKSSRSWFVSATSACRRRATSRRYCEAWPSAWKPFRMIGKNAPQDGTLQGLLVAGRLRVRRDRRGDVLATRNPLRGNLTSPWESGCPFACRVYNPSLREPHELPPLLVCGDVVREVRTTRECAGRGAPTETQR